MALAGGLPPWLAVTPETYTGAMAGGARLGLEARSQDMQQQQAADRLQLAYEQLGSKEEMAANALEGKMQLAQSQMDLKDQTMKLGAALRERGLDQQLFNIQSLDKDRQFREQLADQKQGKQYLHWGKDGSLYQFDPETGQVRTVQTGTPGAGKPASLKLEIPEGTFAPGTGLGSWTGTPAQLEDFRKMMPKQVQRPGFWSTLFGGTPKTNAPSAPTPTAPAVQSAPAEGTKKKMVRVKGPNGQTGSAPEDSALPEGWEVVK